MGAIMACLRAELRHRLRVTLVLAALVGLAGGVVLAAVAGARRTDSAMDRFVAYNRPLDVEVEGEGLDLAAVRRLPQVVDADTGTYMLLTPGTAAGRPDPAAVGTINPFVGVDGHAFRTSERPIVVAGRLADLDQALEVVVDEVLAARRHLRPGATLPMWAYTPAQFEAVGQGGGVVAPRGRRFDFQVTGIVRQPFDLNLIPVDQDVVYLGTQELYLTPAFWRGYHGEVANFGLSGLAVRLRGGQGDVASFTAAVRRLPGGRRATVRVNSDNRRAATRVRRSIHLEAVALLVFAALAAATALLVVGQSIARQAQLEAADHPVLRALGMGRAQLVTVALARAALIGAGGAVLGVALAVLLSPLTPLGLARQAEVRPGWSVDAPVLAAGAAGILVAVLARAGLAALGAARPAPGAAVAGREGRPSRVAEALARNGAPPSMVAGVRLALEPGGGAAALPARGALAGAVVATVAVAAALTLAASLERLATTPALQGWAWDVVVGQTEGDTDVTTEGVPKLAANRLVAGYTAVVIPPEVRVDGRGVPAVGLDPIKGSVLPPLPTGREPRSADEVALGRDTLQRLGRRVGDVVEVAVGERRRKVRIVGQALFAPAALDSDMAMGRGALFTVGGIKALVPDALAGSMLVSYAPGADREAAFASLRRDFGRTVLRPLPPEEVANLHRVRGLPLLLAGLLGVLGLATLAHTLVSSARLRRRDLAVLKTLGFVRGQVAATLAWQASTLAALALVVGVPLGVALGRWSWVLVDRGLQSLAPPLVPARALGGAVVLTLLVAELVAVLPARTAARIPPAVVLRTE